MDSGLGVRWPLSPYATALAAGALFAFCLALWKHRVGARKGTGKDLSGQFLGKNLDPKKEQDVCEKPDKQKSEAEAERTRNFPVLALRDAARGFNYEHLCLSGHYGAIPRTLQRNQTLENPNLYSAFRRRNAKKESKSWQELNPTSSNFSFIYQQSLCFASELPRLNARFLLNLSPHLQPYTGHLRDIQIPETSRTRDFDNFDVSIKPDILKNRPITRSAVCLALERQLHKFLEEPFSEIKLSDRAIQTVEISEDDDDDASGNSNQRDINLVSESNAETEVKREDGECAKNIGSDLSLWDSGYGEKAFDERCDTPKEYKDGDTLIEECMEVPTSASSAVSDNLDSKICDDASKSNDCILIEECVEISTTTSSAVSENLDIKICDDASKSNDYILIEECVEVPTTKSSAVSDNLDIYDASKLNDTIISDVEYREKVFDELCSTLIEKYNDTQMLRGESGYASTIESEITSESLNITKYSDLLRQTCDDPLDSSDRQVFNERSSALNELYGSESNVLGDESGDISGNKPTTVLDKLNITKDSNSFDEPSVSFLNEGINIQNDVKRDRHPEFSAEHESELNHRAFISEVNSEGIKILNEDVKILTFEDNVDQIRVSKCSDRELGSYRVEIQKSCSEENINRDMDNNSGIHSGSNVDTVICIAEELVNFVIEQSVQNLSSNLERVQNAAASRSEERQKSGDENIFRASKNIAEKEENLDSTTSISRVDAGSAGEDESIECSNLENSDLERIQNVFDSAEEKNTIAISAVPEEKPSEKRNSRGTETASLHDVTEEGSSRDSAVFDEKGTFKLPRQMDRETGERSVAVESTVTTETTLRANGDAARLSTAVVSRLTLDDWSVGSYDKEDSVSVKTTVSEEVFRPTFEEFVPLKSSEKIVRSETSGREDESFDDFESFCSKNGRTEKEELNLSGDDLPSSPRADRLKGLLSRDEQRRARTKFHHLADGSHVGGAMEGEWDRLLRDVLASVSELERWERRHCDVSSDAEDAEQQQHHFSQSDSSFSMEEEALSPKGETPTKVKNLRFKLDPDIFDVPSDDSFYDDDDDDSRRGWKKQSKYRAFSSLELNDEPVRLVSVHASVVPGGQKMVARPVGIDLRVRLTEERQSKRAHVSTSPSQAKRRSPVSDRGIGWCQELSPVTENVDWRETFTPVTPECKSVPNGILKTPSPKIQSSPVESPNPFKIENGVTTNGVTTNGVTTNGVGPVAENKRIEKAKYNGWKPPIERKPFLIIRKKFEPDPEAIERITGYKSALSKPPLPPPLSHKVNSNLTVRNKVEQARKQYLDNKAALANSKVDGTKKFQQFLSQAQSDRARIVTSVPDLAAIERAVTEQWTKERASVSPRESPGREDNKKTEGVTLSRGSTPDDKWASYVQSCKQHFGRRSQSMTYLETDIDIIPVLDEDDKCHSTSALDEPDEALPDPDDSDLDRSREDLDDSGRAKSEHELRIERSLRSLPLPEWYRRSDKTKTGFLLGSSNKEKRGWAAAKSLASSTSSLASCGLRRPVRSLRSSRENIPWSRSSASPDGPTLSLALAKAFREPYLGWRARTPTSSGVSSSPRASPPSWNATTTDDEANGVSFDGEDAFGRTTSSSDRRDEPLSLDDTGADAVTVSMDTNDPVKLPGGEDTCDDINNMSMDTCELFDASVVVPVDEDPSPQADTGDDIDNLSTDTTTTEGRKLDPKLKRYSYSQSIYHSEWDEEEESRGDKKVKEEDREQSPSSPDHKVVWIESSFVGSRTTTSIVVMPEKKAPGSTQERPASR